MAAAFDEAVTVADDSFSVAKLPEALSPPDADLRRRLELFVRTTRGLTQSPLFKSPSLTLECTPRGDGTFNVVCVAPVDDLGMRGLLTYFRKLWQSGEAAQFGRLRSDLRRHVEGSTLPASPELVGWLDDIGKADKAARRALPDFSVLEAEIGESEILRNEAVRAERIVDDWVNGEVFHDDEDKRRRIDWAGDPDAYLFALLSAVQELTKVYVLLARMAKAILDEPALAVD